MPINIWRVAVLILLATSILALDAFSKYLVHTHLPLMAQGGYLYPYGGIGVFKNFLGIDFAITHTINKGAAWGFFSQFQYALLIIRFVLIGGLIAYLLAFNQKKEWQIPLILIISGAIGNVADYFLYGHVVDMLHFELWGYSFPTFNISDTSIFFGIVFMAFFSTSTKRST